MVDAKCEIGVAGDSLDRGNGAPGLQCKFVMARSGRVAIVDEQGRTFGIFRVWGAKRVLRAVVAVLAGLGLLALSFVSLIWGPALVSGAFRVPIWVAVVVLFLGLAYAGLVMVRLWPGTCMMILSDESDNDLRVEEQRRWLVIRRTFRVTDGMGLVVARIECLSSASVGRGARWISPGGLELMSVCERRGRSFARRGVQAVDELLPIVSQWGGMTRLLTRMDWYKQASELVLDWEDAQGQRIGTMVLVSGSDIESTINVAGVDARSVLAMMATVASDRIG